jgi:Mlc titration factor MtfA (ptsG expression regulator)
VLTSLRRLFAPRTADIPEELWQAQLRAMPWLGLHDDADRAALRALCAGFLGEKSISGAAGLDVTAAMQLHIAAQACVPILRLGLAWYRGWSGVVVYPATFRVRRQVHEADGLVQDFDEELAGEAWDGGPVVLSWEDARDGTAGGATPGANVVIHEFAHKIDLLDGAADGIPPLDPRWHAGLDRAEWTSTLEDAYERFCAELELVDEAIPAHIDPDSPAARRYYAHLPLDPYAGTDSAEFFAVSSEAFFLHPAPLAAAFPAWHTLLQRFYRP